MRHRIPREDEGASSVEYGLVLAAVAALVVVVVFSLGTTVAGLFDHSCTNIAAKANPGADC